MKKNIKYLLVIFASIVLLTGCGLNDKKQNQPQEKKVEKIEVTDQTIEIGETRKIDAVVIPEDATNKELVWSVSDSNIIKVSNNGEVKGVSKGNAKIRVMARDGSNAMAIANITVIEKQNNSKISFDKKELTLNVGESSKLTVKVEPVDNKLTFKWKSDNSKIASVDNNGNVKGIMAGETYITATASNNKTATIKVIIKGKSDNTTNNISLSCVKSLNVNESRTLVVNNASNQKLTWKTSDNMVATINQNGVLTGKKVGKVTITVTTDKGQSANCVVEITKEKSKDILVTKIDILNNGAIVTGNTINITKNGSLTLSEKVTPTNATNKKVKWESSNTKVLTVSNGKVTIVGTGTADIKVSSLDSSNKSSKVTIKVSDNTTNTTKIQVTAKYTTINVGNLLQLNTTITPSTADKKVTFTSSNTNIATVDGNGVVNAKAKGTVTITATSSSNKAVKGEISLTINANPRSKIKIASVVRNDVMKKIGNDYRESYSFPVGYMHADGKGYGGNKWVLEIISSDKSDISSIKEVTWTSSNAKVAKAGIRSTADKQHLQGQITALSGGTIIVTANIKFTNGTTANYTTKVNIIANTDGNIKSGSIPSSVPSTSPSYKGTNLVYYTENVNGARLTHIYMKDPQKQIKKLDAATAAYYNKSGACSKKICTEEEMVKNKLSGRLLKVDEMINEYVKGGLISKDEQIIAFNGSGWVNDCSFGPTPGVKCSGSTIVSKDEKLYLEFNKRPVTWIDVLNGVYRSSRINDTERSHWLYNTTIGITKNGVLRRYIGSLNVKEREKIMKEMKADGVINAWNDVGLLINNGDVLPKDTYYNDLALRQAICQVDKNHFIMYSSNTKKNLYDVAVTLKGKGCKTAINLDGGGSIQIYTKAKGKTSASVSMSAQYRSVVNGIYFTDKID